MNTASLPATMIEIGLAGHGGPEVLQPQVVAMPSPGAGELLVQVLAAGVNRPDALQRAGRYPPPPGASPIPGLEVAGTVVALGDGVTGATLGDAVCALTNGGGYAQYCVVPEGQALSVPRGMSMVQAAAIPETFLPCGPICSRSATHARETSHSSTAAPAASARLP